MDRLRLARDVGSRLVAAERAIDAALCEQAALVARLVTAQREARLATVGDVAIARAATGLAALANARCETVACHAELAHVQLRLGVPPVDVGQGDKDPPEPAPLPKPRAQATTRRAN